MKKIFDEPFQNITVQYFVEPVYSDDALYGIAMDDEIVIGDIIIAEEGENLTGYVKIIVTVKK